MSTFSGINTARRGLSAAQLGMETTGQNIANVNTDGYSRQRVEQSASVLNQTGQFALKNVPGDGVVVTGIGRVSDALATATARQDSAAAQEQTTAATIYAGIENAIGDTGATGLSKNLTDLSSSWNDLVKQSGGNGIAGARALVVTRSQTVIDTITSMDKSLQGQYEQLGLQATALATQANDAASNIARLNTSIRETLSTGASANELMDQRDQYLTKLADLTGSRSVNRDNGTVDVFVGNAAIVTGDFHYDLTVTANADNPQVSLGNQWSASIGGQPATPASGSLKATLDGANVTLKTQYDSLNAFTQKFAAAVNTAYSTKPDGTPTDNTTPFFTDAKGLSAITASSIAIESGLKADPATKLGDSAALTTDRSVALSVYKAMDTTKADWRTRATNIAAATQSAANRADLASQVSLKSQAVADGVSGVNLDEEMTNLVAYQHAYSAAAKVLTTMDEALDTLLNMVR